MITHYADTVEKYLDISIIDKPMTLEYAMENSELLLQKTAERIMRVLKINM